MRLSQNQPSPTEIIADHITRALEPFRPGLVTMSVVTPPDYLARGIVVVIHIDLMEDDVFSTRRNDIWLTTNEYDVAHQIGAEAAQWFDSRRDELVGDNIVLGYN